MLKQAAAPEWVRNCGGRAPENPAGIRSWTLRATDLGIGRVHSKMSFQIWERQEIDFSSHRLQVEFDPLGALLLRYGDPAGPTGVRQLGS